MITPRRPSVTIGTNMFDLIGAGGPRHRLSFNNKGSLVIAVEGDPRLINRYDVIELNPQKHAGAKLAAAKIFADRLVSSDGQQAIGAYQVNGQKLFNPSAGSPK